jgi:phosphoribosylformylglycinamidine synthase
LRTQQHNRCAQILLSAEEYKQLHTMIHFFGNENSTVFAIQTQNELSTETITKLNWLFGNVPKIEKSVLSDFFVGPRAAMVTPWSTNAVEITQNMGISGIIRIEKFEKVDSAFY